MRRTRAGTRTRMPRLIPAAVNAPERSEVTTNPCDLTRHAHETSSDSSGSASRTASRVEQLAIDALAAQFVGKLPQLVGMLIGRGDLQRASAPVAHAHSCIAGDALDKRVVHVEAAPGERKERAAEALEKRHEHSRGRLRGPKTGPARIDQDYRGAAGDEFVRNGLADDARSDDGDVTIWHCFTIEPQPLIISRRPGCSLRRTFTLRRGTTARLNRSKPLIYKGFRRG